MIKRELKIGNNSHTTKILLVDDLPPEDVAMCQALYARSPVSAEGHIEKIYTGRRHAIHRELCGSLLAGSEAVEDFADRQEAVRLAAVGDGATGKAGSFVQQYVVKYNHKSIADCGTTTLFIEGISVLADKALQDWPLFSGQETSTRAIDFSATGGDDGVAVLTESGVVGRLVDPIGTPESRAVLNRWMDFYNGSQSRVLEHVAQQHPLRPGEDEAVWRRACKARTFDILRGFLPAGVTTQTSWHTNLRQAGDHLVGLLHHPLPEVQEVARAIAELLHRRYPSSSFEGLAQVSGIGEKNERSEQKAERAKWDAKVSQRYSYNTAAVIQPPYSNQLIDFETTINPEWLTEYYGDIMQDRPRGCMLPAFLRDLGHITCEFPLDYGSWRDIQRQRSMVVRHPLLTTNLGFEPWYLNQLDGQTRHEADQLIVQQEQALDWLSIELDQPNDRQQKIEHISAELARTWRHTRGLDILSQLQYYIPLGYRVPCVITASLPAFVYVVELRSGKTIHPTLRHAVLNYMVKPFTETFPDFVLHIDGDEDDWSIRRGQQGIEKK